MLTHAHKDTIRRTWKLVEPVADTVPDLFYRRLFEIAPQYRSLFSDDMAPQKRKLTAMLAFIVKSLDWPEEFWTDKVAPDQDLVMVVAALGRRHAQLYNIPDAAYVPVGEALLWTLDYGLGEAFTAEVRDAWAALYGVLSKCMIMSRRSRRQRRHGGEGSAMNGRSCVMMGSLSTFSVREVLDVVGLSRQHTVIELHREDGGRFAAINLKGGHLVQGEWDANPRQALGLALRAPESCTFQVFRLDDANSYKSFGQLAHLLTDETALRADTAVAQADPPAQAEATIPVMPPAPPVAAPLALPPVATPLAAAPTAAETMPAESAIVTPMAAATVTLIAPDERRVSRMPGAVRDSKMRMPVPAAPGLSLAITSPKGGVGKTTISLNLGISLAHRGLRVIVIDGDVNGDLLSLINQRAVVRLGSYDLLEDPGQLDQALRATKVHGLRLLPASGRDVPESVFAQGDRTEQWRALIREAQRLADVVIVDCPAGVTHTTAEILQSVTHVLGVFQAETVASRSFEMFERGLASLGDRERPVVAGVVVNMLRKDAASARAYEALIASDPSRRVLETAITRSEAFEDAAAAATPVRLHGGEASRKMAWLFDNLAAELVSRLPLGQSPADNGAFLL